MPTIRNSSLFKKFTDFFQLKSNDFLDSEAGRMLVPVITHPILPLIVTFTPTEAEFLAGIFVPAGKKWKLKQLHIRWTADATAGNREIELTMTDGSTDEVTLRIATRNFQVASTTADYNFAIGMSHVGSSSAKHQTIPLPADLSLLEGTKIVVKDRNAIAAGDTIIGEGFILVEEESTLEDEVENDRAI